MSMLLSTVHRRHAVGLTIHALVEIEFPANKWSRGGKNQRLSKPRDSYLKEENHSPPWIYLPKGEGFCPKTKS